VEGEFRTQAEVPSADIRDVFLTDAEGSSMSLTLPPRPRRYVNAHASGIGPSRVRPVVLGLAAALTVAYAWVIRTSAGDMATASTMAVAVALVLFTLAVAPGARRRPTHRDVRHPGPSLPPDQQVTPAAPSSVGRSRDIRQTQAASQADDPVVAEPAWLQALRSRVHTLESTIEEQELTPTRTQAQLDETDSREGDLARVGLTLKALRERVSGQPESEAILDRVEAALSRLNASPGLHRPTLPVTVARASVVLGSLAPEPSTGPAASPVLIIGEPAAITPAPIPPPPPVIPEPAAITPAPIPPPPPAAPPDAHEPSATEAPPAVTPTREERVLPVPANPVAPSPKARRWRRRGAA
jgi:hypothetical protein